MNSKFSNNMPKAKVENFGNIDEIKNGLSLKLLEMMDIVRDKNEWGETEIAEFGKLAKERLKNGEREPLNLENTMWASTVVASQRVIGIIILNLNNSFLI